MLDVKPGLRTTKDEVCHMRKLDRLVADALTDINIAMPSKANAAMQADR
jgi:hypothetical protein